MVSENNIKWYMTADVAKALRSKQLAITSERAGNGDVFHEVTNTDPARAIRKAQDLAHKGGSIAEQLGTPWAVVSDRLGLRIQPDMLIAAAIGAPYEWSMSVVYQRAADALAEIEAVYGPVRRRVAAEAA
jgi:hypothetical protein